MGPPGPWSQTDSPVHHAPEGVKFSGGDYWTYDPIWGLMTLIELLPGPPSVYSPWLDFGLPHLTDALMLERSELYLASLLDRYNQ